ncbi:SIS domain-containing protein [Motiliproteus sediminis]|uniref:SIS domain-containing protein n=1 Tax=Motiliproteus sediminis TaxID=1468178 RepID=UPI001AEFD70D|nr:SIS domain-containing protein [Motiliproteus sediminis]
MDLQQRLIEHFHTSLDLKAHVIEEYAPQIELAAQQLFHSLISENKILTCGNGPSGALAQYCSALLINRYQHERPGLPAMALSADSASLTAIAADSHFGDIYSKQIRALGQPGDVLLVLSSNGRSASLIQAVQAAHDREMVVVALTGDQDDLTALLQPDDIEIRIPSDAAAMVNESHLLIIHCLCDLVEFQLFGGME